MAQGTESLGCHFALSRNRPLYGASAPSLFAASAQVGFSPEGTAQQLVINVIGSAKDNIRMMAYSFTAPDIMKALIAAKRRGVDVKIVVDENGNTGRASRAAMNLVTNAGIPLRVNSNYKIQHDKVIIVDGRHVETGSFNYTASAEKYNSENAIVMWDAPELAGQYLKHWQSRWNQGRDFTPSY
ncbi:TPA: phospholipase D family protein [Klebsiella pneumoniae]|uniref:phospholipase D family nuclease n=1 Tax=Klebsiella pneumoniae TaxID=573 RepID=UPI00403F0C3C